MTARDRTVGVVGLGVMGSAVATHLLQAGINVVGTDPDEEVAERLRGLGVMMLPSSAAVAQEGWVTISALPSSAALHAVVSGPMGLLSGPPDGVLLELSTLPLADKLTARERLRSVGIRMLDCPVSGTGAQAAVKDLTVFMSGEPEDVALCESIVATFADRPINVGLFGAGSKIKFIANLLVGIHNVATAEALALADKAGLDLHQVIEVLSGSAATSRMLEVRGPLIAAERFDDPSMRLELFLKDIGIIEEFAAETGCSAPLFSLCAQLYRFAEEMGLGRYDSAAVARVFGTLPVPSAPSDDL